MPRPFSGSPAQPVDGSLEVSDGTSPAYIPMPRADLQEPINGPTTEKWCAPVHRLHPHTCPPISLTRARRCRSLSRWYEDDPDQGLRRMGCCGKKIEGDETFMKGGLFGGVVDDYRRRFPNYMKDITQGITPKTLSSALFMFFATFFSTASLGALIQKATNKRIGLEEYLLMNAIAGMTHALFGCQVRLYARNIIPGTHRAARKAVGCAPRAPTGRKTEDPHLPRV